MHLSKKELEVMETLWFHDRPMSRQEIIDATPERTWKDTSLNSILNKLMDNGFVRVDGHLLIGNILGRAYTYQVSEVDYHTEQLAASMKRFGNSSLLSSLLSNFISDNSIDDQTINEIESLIQKRKDESD